MSARPKIAKQRNSSEAARVLFTTTPENWYTIQEKKRKKVLAYLRSATCAVYAKGKRLENE